MIHIDDFSSNFEQLDTIEMKRRDFKELYDIVFKDSNPDIDINDRSIILNAYHNKKEWFKRYAILKKQLFINSVLDRIMKTVNENSDSLKVSPFNDVRINSVIDSKELYEKLYDKGIDITGYDVGLMTLDEIRTYLYDSVGIKVKSMAEMYDNEIKQKASFYKLNMNFGDVIAQGINPESIIFDKEDPYIDMDFILEHNLLKEYITKGTVYGSDVLKVDNKMKKSNN